MEPYELLDEAILPFNAFASGVCDLEGVISSETAGVRMRLKEAAVELPILMDIQPGAGGDLLLGASPPLYYVATGIESVYHKIKITVIAEEGGGQNSISDYGVE